MQRFIDLTREERLEELNRELPCRDFDWDCLATDGIVPFGDYRKCQMYDPERGKCLFVTSQLD
ncbi:MAG TPA: hypothetical protein ENO22_13415 [candidate division Zixibacteria bacterium]|nr:hypothetical protein [candidate division Zixibacteria bacterium]